MTDEEAIEAAQRTQQSSLPKEFKESNGSMPDVVSGIKLDSLMNSSAGNLIMVVMRDPAFRQASAEIAQKFNKTTFMGYEFAWIVLIWVFRSWRLTKVNTLLTRLWTQAWVGMVFWVGALTLIPWILWGKSYQLALASVIRGLIHQF